MPVQTILDGPRNVVVKITDSDVDAGIAVDVASLNPPCTRVNVMRVWFSCLDSQAITLAWDATSPEVFMTLHGQQDFNFECFGGITNDAGAGVNGNIDYALPANGGTVVLFCTKHGIINTPL